VKKVSFGAKPPAATPPATADAWVANKPAGGDPAKPAESIKRLTIDLPLGLHRRVKAGCVREEVYIADVVRNFLDARFPAKSHGHDDTTTRKGGKS
jgi:hypothetical protein